MVYHIVLVYTKLYTMLNAVLTYCWVMWYIWFCSYVPHFSVISLVARGYMLMYITRRYHKGGIYQAMVGYIWQTCGISYDIWCHTVPEAGPLRLPLSSCTGTPRVPVTGPGLDCHKLNGLASLLAQRTPGIVACSSLPSGKIAGGGSPIGRLTAHAYIAVNSEHGNGNGQAMAMGKTMPRLARRYWMECSLRPPGPPAASLS